MTMISDKLTEDQVTFFTAMGISSIFPVSILRKRWGE